ncbi:MAG: thioredoxin family protein [Candidatus Cyclobacteriaceae bacterium M3_2C_046]
MAITQAHIEQALSYPDYIQLIESLLKQNKTTGLNQSPKLLEYTKLNLQRSKRIEKTLKIQPELADKIKNLKQSWIWLILTEAWCGDAAQNIPVLYKLSSLNPNIQIKLLLRDQHMEVMDAYLTNGSRSIPKLICLQQESLEEIGVWGPRPGPAQAMIQDYKKNPTMSYQDFGKEIQTWYSRDKAATIQQEFSNLVNKWNR